MTVDRINPGSRVWVHGNGVAATGTVLVNSPRRIVVQLAGGASIHIENTSVGVDRTSSQVAP